MVIPITKINVPNHLPKMNPDKSATGKPNPANTTQIIVDIKNIEHIKNKLFCFNPEK